MEQTRTYSPLNEGYSGSKSIESKKGYAGNNENQTITPPQTIRPLQSALIKPSSSEKKS